MNSNLAITSYNPSFTAVTTVKNPAKLLSDADVSLIKSLGEKLGNNATDSLSFTIKQSEKHPGVTFNCAYAAKVVKNGQKCESSSNGAEIPFAKISPIDFVKRRLASFASFFGA